MQGYCRRGHWDTCDSPVIIVGIACSGLGAGGGLRGEVLTCCVILHKSHPSLGLSFVICHVRSLGRGSPRLMSGNWSIRALMKEAME